MARVEAAIGNGGAAPERTKPRLRDQIGGALVLGAELAVLASVATVAIKPSRRITRERKIAEAGSTQVGAAATETKQPGRREYINISNLLDTGAYQLHPRGDAASAMHGPRVTRVRKVS